MSQTFINLSKTTRTMGKVHSLSEKEKELLTALGKFPDISVEELLNHVTYRWTSTIIKKIKKFKKQGILNGPFYITDYGKLCKNSLRMAYCIAEFNRDYKTVISYVTLIEPLVFVYPVLSSRKELLNMLFLSSDTAEMNALFQLLKDNTIITDYAIRVSSSKGLIENPNFFGDPDPSFDNLFEPCSIPDISYGCHDTNWNECDIHILPYLRMGYKNTKLIEILKAEKTQNKTWKYNQIAYSFKKMLEKKLIRRTYLIHPYPPDQCTDFNLFLTVEDSDAAQRILYNFAKGARVCREYVPCNDWEYMGFSSHPRFLTGLMKKLDSVDEIKAKELYQLRSFPPGEYYFERPFVLKYFDFENQTLEYPYRMYREKIKEKIENELK